MILNQNFSDSNEYLDKYNKHTGVTPVNYFVVFRVDRKYKTLNSIKQFEIHNLRKREVPNADPNRTYLNRVLIGSENVVEDVKNYIYGIKLRSNAVIARDMILTVNHKFFDELPPGELEKWIQCNLDFLKENFGDNIVSAILHQDESSSHLHCLCVPRFYSEKRQRYELSNSNYFGSKALLRDWQTKYADHMHKEFNNLVRGIRGSKARHIDIKDYYTMINKKLDIKDDRSIIAHAKNSYLLEKRNRILANTIMQLQEDKRNEKLLKRVEAAEKKSKEYKEVANEMMNKFKISKKDVLEIIDKMQERNNSESER